MELFREVIITPDQCKADNVAGFPALEGALDKIAFAGNLCSKVIMTLLSFLCTATTYLLQSDWHWLWDAKHKVEKENSNI